MHVQSPNVKTRIVTCIQKTIALQQSSLSSLYKSQESSHMAVTISRFHLELELVLLIASLV